MRRDDSSRSIAASQDAEEQKEEDIDVFDDTDFYQQLLRDVIDSRGDNGSGTANDWVVLQKQRKAKKKVDTKASKGRKLRYAVHEKLQNFMVPVPATGTWHEEQIDELFSSLLGKGFERVADGGGEPLGKADPLLSEAVRGGFKIFG